MYAFSNRLKRANYERRIPVSNADKEKASEIINLVDQLVNTLESIADKLQNIGYRIEARISYNIIIKGSPEENQVEPQQENAFSNFAKVLESKIFEVQNLTDNILDALKDFDSDKHVVQLSKSIEDKGSVINQKLLSLVAFIDDFKRNPDFLPELKSFIDKGLKEDLVAFYDNILNKGLKDFLITNIQGK